MKKKYLILVLVLKILLILIGLGYSYLTQSRKIRITNVTSNSATVTWETIIPVNGTVSYCKVDEKSNTCLNDEKIVKTNSNFNTHYLELENLDSEQNYKFKVKSGLYSLSFLNNFAENMTWSTDTYFKTYSVIENPLVPSPVYGKVECENNEKDCFSNAIMFLKIKGYTPISTRVNDTGGWSLDLSATRNLESGEVAQFNNKIPEVQIYVDAGKFGDSDIQSVEIDVNQGLIETIKIKK